MLFDNFGPADSVAGDSGDLGERFRRLAFFYAPFLRILGNGLILILL